MNEKPSDQENDSHETESHGEARSIDEQEVSTPGDRIPTWLIPSQDEIKRTLAILPPPEEMERQRQQMLSMMPSPEEAERQRQQMLSMMPSPEEAERQRQQMLSMMPPPEEINRIKALLPSREVLQQLAADAQVAEANLRSLFSSPIAEALRLFNQQLEINKGPARELIEQSSQALKLMDDAFKSESLGKLIETLDAQQKAITQQLRRIGPLPKEARPATGQLINVAKLVVDQAHAGTEMLVESASLNSRLAAESIDVSLPGRPVSLGHLHVITETARDIVHTFEQMGFQVVEGPEVELDLYNFELLNIPPEHPARSSHDTFYLSQSENLVLRTHTSPNQIRTMLREKPPIRVVVPGRTFRAEATDATHEANFQQVEGLAIDKGITLADLKGTLAAMARALFGADRKVRFRCDYFPYVEPGVDLSVNCLVCNGVGCKACKFTGYLEIMGAGMVHPQVLRNGGIDPDVYSGFAFGMGIERITMLRHSIDDIRLFYDTARGNDLRFLRQFA